MLEEEYYGKVSEVAMEIGVNQKLAKILLKDGIIPSVKTGSEIRRRYYTTKSWILHAANKIKTTHNLPDNSPLKKVFLTKNITKNIFETKNKNCTIVCMTNQKGGVGKTTDAVNFAVALAKLGQKTLVIDMDSQSHSSRYINRGDDDLSFEGKSVLNLFYKLTQREDLTKEIVESYIVSFDNIEEEGYGIDILPSEIRLARMMELTRMIPNAEKLLYKEIIGKIKTDYDYIIIDTPPSASLSLSSSLYACDIAVISTELNKLAEEGMRATIEEIGYLSKNIEKEIGIGAVIINSYSLANKMDDKYLKKTIDNAMSAEVDYPDIYSVKSSPSLVSETQDQGIPIIESKKRIRETLRVVSPFMSFAISLIEKRGA